MKNLKARIYSRSKLLFSSINKWSGILSLLAIVSTLALNSRLNKFPTKLYFAENLPLKVYSNDSEGRLMGIGEIVNGNWVEYITFKKKSRLNDNDGESAIVVHNINNVNKTFELGFYAYGSTWATDHELVEFWIGNQDKGASYSSLSIRPMAASFGSRLEIRNNNDTKAIVLDNWDSFEDFREVVHQPMKK